jgi:hypothetical protein
VERAGGGGEHTHSCYHAVEHVIMGGCGSGACGSDVGGHICHTSAFPRAPATTHLHPPAHYNANGCGHVVINRRHM